MLFAFSFLYKRIPLPRKLHRVFPLSPADQLVFEGRKSLGGNGAGGYLGWVRAEGGNWGREQGAWAIGSHMSSVKGKGFDKEFVWVER